MFSFGKSLRRDRRRMKCFRAGEARPFNAAANGLRWLAKAAPPFANPIGPGLRSKTAKEDDCCAN
jgi:hypothetical protein